jgi:hypothetical protein
MGNQVAKDVVAYCTSCKMGLIHSIVTVDGEKRAHATFGVGLVKSLLFPNKMKVLFKEGTKLLVRSDSEANSRSLT